MFLFFDGDACVEQENSQREFACTKELSVRTDFSENSRLYIVLKLLHDHTSSTTQYLFFLGHG